ncbi:MAG: efflux RND transporter permease subunit, partial [Dehalococcoidia bacterium]
IALVEQLKKQGTATHDALIEGGRTRLRPILMTALTTMFAMLPLAFGLGAGTLLAAELAVVVIGGLFSSTLLTLLVIPVIYSLVDGVRQRRAGSR